MSRSQMFGVGKKIKSSTGGKFGVSNSVSMNTPFKSLA